MPQLKKPPQPLEEPHMGATPFKAKLNTAVQDFDNAMGEFPPIKFLQSDLGQALLAILPLFPKGKIGDTMLREHPGAPETVINPKPQLGPEFTAVGEEPSVTPPPDPTPGIIEQGYQNVLKKGKVPSRTGPDAKLRKPK